MNSGDRTSWYESIELSPEYRFLRCDIRERGQREKELIGRLAEYELMMRETHHRMKNNILSVSSVLSLQMDAAREPAVADALAQAVRRVTSMRVLYDVLLEMEGFVDVPVRQYVDRLIDAIADLAHGSAAITIDRQIDSFTIAGRVAYPLGLALTEFLTNAMKYAFVGRESGHVLVRVQRSAEGVRLSVDDDGRGLPEDFDSSAEQGLGLSIVRLFARQFDGRFELRNRSGRGGVRALIELTLTQAHGRRG
ncbi:MAG: sensor histidine kinase [Spirochaetota bacterium]